MSESEWLSGHLSLSPAIMSESELVFSPSTMSESKLFYEHLSLFIVADLKNLDSGVLKNNSDSDTTNKDMSPQKHF
jgi:hypothetical protein